MKPKLIVYFILKWNWVNPLWYAMMVIAPAIVFVNEGVKMYVECIRELWEATKTFKKS